jgi:subtilase family serine protease
LTRASLSVGALLATCAVGLGATGVAAAAPGETTLPGSGAPALGAATDLGAVAPATSEQLQVWLAPDAAGATQFDDAVSTPGNVLYHRYLSPDEYTARFGPSAAEATAVASWLTSAGFTGVTPSPGRDYVSATGTAATVDGAFSVQLHSYSVTGATGATSTITANDQDLSLPSSLSGDVISVTGLNSTPPVTYHTATGVPAAPAKNTGCSDYWGQHTATVSPPFHGITQAGLSVCGYSADQLRDAYGQTSANAGAGETVALIEDGVPTAMFQTLKDYARANGLPKPADTQLRQESIGSNSCGNPFDIEEQLDSESLYAMAPAADQLMVEGDSCNFKLEGVQPLFDAELAVLAGNGDSASASIESNSWGITGGESFPAVYAETAHAINLRATAEGVGMYFSSGDSPGVSVPASDPYSLAVGGTTIGIGGSDERLFETGWSNQDGVLEGGQWFGQGIPRDAAGGGASVLYGQPDYQAGVVPASMATVNGQLDRALPDVSADADPNTGILQGVIELNKHGQPGPYQTFVDGGTSLAAPLVAGIVADAEQGQPTSFGFINPLLYSLAATPAFHDALPVTAATPAIDRAGFAPKDISIYGAPSLSIFDSQLPQYTSQVTAPGYDTMTGLGTPNGTFFINALRSGS